jgi:hypothetical protein
MAALCRACPSSRLSGSSLYRLGPANVAQYVGAGLFFGDIRKAIVTRKRVETTTVNNIKILARNAQKRKSTIGRAQPSDRLRSADLYKSNPSDIAQYVGNDIFFGQPYTDYLHVITPDVNNTVPIVNLSFEPYALDVIGPKPFNTGGGGTTANVGYGG